MRPDRFDWDQFHDSCILDIDFSNWREVISITLLCPNADYEERRFRIQFYRVLHFGFETAVLGELGSTLPLVHNVVLERDSRERRIWLDRIEELARPDADYPEGMQSDRYTEVYHVIFDSADFEGRACLPEDQGFQIVCRDLQIIDVTGERSLDT